MKFNKVITIIISFKEKSMYRTKNNNNRAAFIT